MNSEVKTGAAYKALDLFCGAGGMTKGLQRAGFYAVGVDIEDQPNYCGDEFIRADALTFPLEGFDLVCASPKCQGNTTLKHLWKDRAYPEQIAPVRRRLVAAGVPYVIENVAGARGLMINPVTLCGSSFGLGVRRHRLFESNVPLHSLPCDHASQPEPVDVSGTGARRLGARLDGKGGNSRKPRSLEEAREAMGIGWMNRRELSQAIPPAYAEHIGRQIVAYLDAMKTKAA